MRIQSLPVGRVARFAVAGLALTGFLLVSNVGDASARAHIAAAGNGGTALASGNGGAVLLDDVNSGGNGGSLIGVGDVSYGSVAIDGGGVGSSTDVAVGVTGGVGISDAAGGDDNLAFDDV